MSNMTDLFDTESGVRRTAARSLNEFLEECRGFMRVRRLSLRTESACLHYIERFIRFHHKRPEEMGRAEVEAFLTHLALRENVAASTQNVALNALVFLHRRVLGFEELDLGGTVRAKRPVRVPRTCWKAAAIFARFRNCSATKMSARP